VKKYAVITLLATALVGCDNNSAPLSFTPEMASFSNEFDFDPLRGPVKDFTQTLFNEKGEVSKRVTGTCHGRVFRYAGAARPGGQYRRRAGAGCQLLP
jgi:hypothetical protein